MFCKRDVSPCLKCGSLGPKYKDSSRCKACEKQDSRNRREHRKLEDPEWHAGELAKLKQYKRDHPSSGDKRGYHGYYPPHYWEAALDAFSHQCAYCGTGRDLQRDHVVPYNNGGRMAISNIVPSCPECNVGKSTQNMRDYVNDECLYESIIMGVGDAEYLARRAKEQERER